MLSRTPVTTQKDAGAPLTREGVHMCPGYLGGVQWNGPAFSPRTGLLYVPSIDWCATFHENPEEPRGGGYRMDPLAESRGWVTAVQYVAVMSGSDSALWGSHGSPTVIVFTLP